MKIHEIDNMYWSAKRWLAVQYLTATIKTEIVMTMVDPLFHSGLDTGTQKMSYYVEHAKGELIPTITTWTGPCRFSGTLAGKELSRNKEKTYSVNDSVSGESKTMTSGVLCIKDGAPLGVMMISPKTNEQFAGKVTFNDHSQEWPIPPTNLDVEIDLLDLDVTLPTDEVWRLEGVLDRSGKIPSLTAGNIASTAIAEWEIEATPSPAVTTIDIWVNAFIPKDIPGVTKDRPNHKGETMISGLPFGDSYLTDQRSFSSSPEASSRMQQRFRIDLENNHVVSWGKCDATISVDTKTGAQTEAGVGASDRLVLDVVSVDNGVKDLSQGGNTDSEVVLRMKGEANNPLLFVTKLVGDIDWEGTWTITVSADLTWAKVAFVGLVDAVPAFEAYASLSQDGANPVRIFTIGQAEGATAAGNLGGTANRPVQAEVTLYP